ncbi:SGNH/GDSL hydrolase family protein [Herbidospora sp. RD11066]
MSRPVVRMIVLVSMLVAGLLTAQPAAAAPKTHLVGTWSAAVDRLPTAIGGQTVRMIVRLSVGGPGLRIRLSNVYGSGAIVLRSVHAGLQAYGAEIETGTNRPVLFKGRNYVRIPAGQAAWSDPLPGRYVRGSDLVVSVFVPGNHSRVTGHERAYATTFLSDPGDHAAKDDGWKFTYTSTQWYFLDRVAVTAPTAVPSVVAIGDSLTDGAGQPTDSNRRWTDFLNQRLKGKAAVLNMGIAGNRLLQPVTGPSVYSRFGRDALGQPGVRTVVVYAGINDITKGAYTSAAPFIRAYKNLIRFAHRHKVKVVGATLTPFYGYPAWTEDREAVRQQVNQWIRTSGAFDAVADFDAALRDPTYPDQLRASYDSGDHIHLSDAGRRKLAYSIRLSQIV